MLPTRSGTHVVPEDLILYAMQYLAAEQAAVTQRHLPECAPCREELGRIAGDLAAVALTAETFTPGPSARERLLAQVEREKKIVAPSAQKARASSPVAPEPELRPLADFGRGKGTTLVAESDTLPSERPPVVRWVGWAAAGALAASSIVLYKEHRSLQENLANVTGEMQRLNARAAESHKLMDALTDPRAIRATLAPRALSKAAMKGPTGALTYNASEGALVFLASNLDPVQVYKTYELWIIPADGSPQIPAGTFHPDQHGNASVLMPRIPKGVDAKSFEVTIEDAGGADKPTRPVILTTS